MDEIRSPISGAPLPRGKPFTKDNAGNNALKANEAKRENYSIKNSLLRELAKTKRMKDGRTLTGWEAMAEAAVVMSVKNPRFWELIRDTIGEKPTDKMDVHGSIGDFNILVGPPNEPTDD